MSDFLESDTKEKIESLADESLTDEALADEVPSADESIGDEASGEFAELLRELPAEVLAFLVRATSPRVLWDWLNEDEQWATLRQVTRGFQLQQNVLRQPIVRSRLTHHLTQHPEVIPAMLKLWGTPAPPVVEEVRTLAAATGLIEALPSLLRRYGAEALLLSLLLDERTTAIAALEELAESIEDNIADNGTEETAVPAPEPVRTEIVTAETASATHDETTELRVELDHLRQQLDEARNKIIGLESSLKTTRDNLAAREEAHKNVARQLEAQIKAATRRAENSEAREAEAARQLDRTARRLRHETRVIEETSQEDKRLKRQMRRQQEINEELRKQLASLTARYKLLAPPEETPEAAPPQTATSQNKALAGPRTKVQAPLAPGDQPFIWNSYGRQFRVSANDVKRAIDRNNEEWVFMLIQAVDSLHETNAKGYQLFLDRISGIDRYYSRVLTVDTTRVLVDASNVARYEKNRYGKGQLKNLLAMRAELRRRDCFPIHIYADASLPYNIDEPQKLVSLAQRGEIEFTNSGQEADELLAREARRTGAYVVTNDRNFFTKVTPDFEPPRISFRIYEGALILDEF